MYRRRTSSRLLRSLTLVQRHAYPMFYELNFEAICRFPASGSAFGLELLYNDHTVRDNTFYRNDGSSVGSERSWWLNPLPSSHHFVCSRSETVYT
ncbi:unnamed protein product [Rotaria socialis]|uniref:Uncharacterized protein n=1 Tax=Rotaria socialis TaxID=392032 RepID=A0A818EUW2_9BILA|nr:unnamed protein product [Rotaria socialis]CAF4665640.1 unnamed protein product [Rotaria socialis]